MSASIETSCLRFDALKFRDQLVLWAARHWIAASPKRPTMPSLVREAFEIAGIPEATPLLHEELTIISTCARQTILFSPVGDPMLSAEEARFLTLLTLARTDGCDEHALALLLQWVPEPAALRARDTARNLSLCIFLEMKGRSDDCPRSCKLESSSASTLPDRGVSLIH